MTSVILASLNVWTCGRVVRSPSILSCMYMCIYFDRHMYNISVQMSKIYVKLYYFVFLHIFDNRNREAPAESRQAPPAPPGKSTAGHSTISSSSHVNVLFFITVFRFFSPVFIQTSFFLPSFSTGFCQVV